MTKQIEDYQLPQNLEDWLNMWNTIPKASARAQFVEMQKQIDSLTEQNKELKANVNNLHSALSDEKVNYYCPDAEKQGSNVCSRVKACSNCRDKLYIMSALEESPKQSLAEHDKNNLIAFVSDVNETGQFGWTDCQWLTDYVEEYMEQLKDSNND